MIDESGNARITDFDLAKFIFIRDSVSFQSISEVQDQTLRWTAPETLESGKAESEESDVYSFAMVMIEVGEPSIFAILMISPVGQGLYR